MAGAREAPHAHRASHTRAALIALVALAALLAPAAWPARSEAASAATLHLQTTPHLPGVGVVLDDRTYHTDASGSVVIGTVAGVHAVRLQPPTTLPAGRTAQPVGWLGIRELPRQLDLPPGRTDAQVAFIVSQRIRVVVTDDAGRPVPKADVSRVLLVSSLGEHFTLQRGAESVLVPINGVIHPQEGYVSVPVKYSVRSVLVQGAEVVHRGGQTFSPDVSGDWVIRALIFPLRIQVRDALFHFPIGSGAVLSSHFGLRRTLTLGDGHEVLVASVPRGTYDLTAKGAGFGLTSVTTVSRPQAAEVLLFSWVDIGVVVAFALVFVVGLPLMAGRLTRRPGSRLVGWRERRTRHVTPAANGMLGVAAGGSSPKGSHHESVPSLTVPPSDADASVDAPPPRRAS